MGINNESDVSATLTIGPTTEGMVRVYVEADGLELPMDFFPDEAKEIAEELRLAAEAVATGANGQGGKGRRRSSSAGDAPNAAKEGSSRGKGPRRR
ncbi:MAG: DUF6324 family protein [Pseudomonadota bacterium]